MKIPYEKIAADSKPLPEKTVHDLISLFIENNWAVVDLDKDAIIKDVLKNLEEGERIHPNVSGFPDTLAFKFSSEHMPINKKNTENDKEHTEFCIIVGQRIVR